jgi:hypothetical protein
MLLLMMTYLMIGDAVLDNDDVTNERPDFESLDIALGGHGFTISKYGKIIAEYGIKVTFWNDGKYNMRLTKIR